MGMEAGQRTIEKTARPLLRWGFERSEDSAARWCQCCGGVACRFVFSFPSGGAWCGL